MKKTTKWALILPAIALLAIQVIPVERTNPPAETEGPAPAEVQAILRRACYDCHSNETVWPWYSRIAPASWLVARDVREGREAMNFSSWNRLNDKDRRRAMRRCWKEVKEGEMPLWFYLRAHPDAHLSDDDRSVLQAWSESGSGMVDVKKE